MKTCKHCGEILNDDDRYCHYCGTCAYIKTDKPHHRRRNIFWYIIVAVLVVILSTLLYSHFSTSVLELVPNRISFLKSGGDAMIEVKYDGYTWHVEKSPDWLEVLAHDRYVYVKALPNESMKVRTGIVKVRSGSKVASINVAQESMVTFIVIAVPVDTVSPAGGRLKIDFQTDGLSPEIQIPEYCRVVGSSDTDVVIEFDANDSAERIATITLLEDTCRKSVTVVQPGPIEIPAVQPGQ